jgi:hypothetical protein
MSGRKLSLDRLVDKRRAEFMPLKLRMFTAAETVQIVTSGIIGKPRVDHEDGDRGLSVVG